MNGNKKIILIVIIVAIVAVLAVLVFKTINDNSNINPNPDGKESGDNIETNEDDGLAAKVKIETVKLHNTGDNSYIDCMYPEIRSFDDKEFEEYINNQIAINIMEYRDEIAYMIDDDTLDVTLYKYTADYDKYTWGDYLTLVVNQDYQTGGIRSNTWKDIYNIDASTERLIYLKDLFEPTVDYETAIVEEVMKQSDDIGYKILGGDGLKKLPTRQQFYIQGGELIIYFDPSEIAANEYGELSFKMPFKLNEDGFFEVN